MRILFDTNVALTYLSGRDDPFSKEAAVIMKKCAEGEVEGALAFHSLSTIWYAARKIPEDKRRDMIRLICDLLTISSADNKAILEAINDTEFKDFEDAMQDRCAVSFHADYTITANVKDFKNVSHVPALTPKEFLELFNYNVEGSTT